MDAAPKLPPPWLALMAAGAFALAMGWPLTAPNERQFAARPVVVKLEHGRARW